MMVLAAWGRLCALWGPVRKGHQEAINVRVHLELKKKVGLKFGLPEISLRQ